MNRRYRREWTLSLTGSSIDALFADIETLVRLAPQWDVKSLRMETSPAMGCTFFLDVEHDRTETPVSYRCTIEELRLGSDLKLVFATNDQRIDFSMRVLDEPNGKRIAFDIGSDPLPEVPDMLEYDLWARSVLNYLKISESRWLWTRVWKKFLDRWWLRMSQSGKRLVFFIVVADGFSLVFLVALLVWWKFFSGP